MSAIAQTSPVMRHLARIRGDAFVRTMFPAGVDVAAFSTKANVTATVADDKASTTTKEKEDWAEVVHQSGQVYYWNQRTGETTQLGDPKPAWEEGSGAAGAGDTSTGNMAESPLPDRTGFYAGVGVLAGAVLGWSSQFF